VKEFLNFRKMLTPMVIQIVFWLAVIMVVIASFGIMANVGVLEGLMMLIVGPLVVRIYCELLIVIFRIHDELVMIRTGGTGEAPGFPVVPTGPTPAQPIT